MRLICYATISSFCILDQFCHKSISHHCTKIGILVIRRKGILWIQFLNHYDSIILNTRLRMQVNFGQAFMFNGELTQMFWL